MNRIRLQIQILPWEGLNTHDPARSQARQDEVRPWTQPEPSDNTLQQLVDNIVERYARIYVGKGVLDVKELQDFWGSTLDLTDRVGDIFNDRSSSGDIHTSICKVVRYPPEPAELYNPQRFASLLPESTARPQKRPPPPPPLFRDAQKPLPTIENRGLENGELTVGHANKRRKTSGARTPSHSREMLPPGQMNSRGISIARRSHTQISEPQVADSQASSKVEIPYDIHTSLLNSSYQDSRHGRILYVPDSPVPGRAITNSRTRERTKSESPELRLSVHEIAPSEPKQKGQEATAQTEVAVNNRNPEYHDAQEATVTQSHPGPGPFGSEREVWIRSLARPAGPVQLPQEHSNSKPKSPAITWRHSYKPPTDKRSGPEVFDPIESDTESFREKQQMFNAKRSRPSKTPPRAVPSIPINDEMSEQRHDQSEVRPLSPKLPELPTSNHDPGDYTLSQGSSSTRCGDFAQQPKNAAAQPETQSPVGNTVSNTGQESLRPDVFQQIAQNERLVERAGLSKLGTQKPKSALEKSSVDPNVRQSVFPVVKPDFPINHSKEILEPTIIEQRSPSDEGRPKQDLTGNPISGSSRAEKKSSYNRPEGLSSADSSHLTNIVTSKHESLEDSSISHTSHNSAQEDVSNGPQEIHSRENSISHPSKGGMLQRAIDAAEMKNSQADTQIKPNSQLAGLKERQLTEQAEITMLAADGAKQLEFETSKSKGPSTTPRGNGWINATGRTSKPNKAYERAHKTTEQHRIAAEKFRNSYNAKTPPSSSENLRNAASKNRTFAPHFLDQGHPSEAPSSSASHVTNVSDRKRRTLTPLVPGSPAFKKPQASSPLSSKSSAGPLRSAMKQPSSSLRRSVSQVSFGGALPGGEPRITGKCITPTTPSGVKPEKAIGSSKSSVKPTSKLASQKHVQSKLNVTRDKKQKGRLKNPPLPAKDTPRKNTDDPSNSNESISSYVSNEDVGFGIAKAGPSAKKKKKKQTSSSALERSDPPISDHLSSSIDPALQSLSQPTRTSIGSTTTKSSSTKSTAESGYQRKSNKSSPTQASEAISISSGSSSEFESDLDSENDSPPLPLRYIANTSNRAENVVVNGTQSSQSSSKLSSDSVDDSLKRKHDVNRTDNDKEALRKPQEAQPPSQTNKASTNVGSDGMLLNGMRPANYRYPSLSQLKREREGRNEKLSANSAARSSEKSRPVEDVSLDSESDSDSSESNTSRDGEDETRRKSNSGMVSGFKGILKLVRGSNGSKT